MKIVKFNNGKYALRKFSLLELQWVYKDLKSPSEFWWGNDKPFFKDCLADSVEEVRENMHKKKNTACFNVVETFKP